jgi:tetratricopeptide (TPR) repeat protein
MVFQAEDRTKAKRQQADLAIRAALEGRWSEAAELNETIVGAFPADVDALNRLGKAYTELGKYDDARKAYKKTLKLDTLNAIARKNLSKLDSLDKAPKKMKKRAAGQKLAPHMFIEETGKTGNTVLIRPTMKIAVQMSPGDQAKLRKDKRGGLFVDTMDGEQLGEIEPRLAQRLSKLVDTGNEYVAAVSSVSDQGVRVFIRETFQDASNVGKLSFPPSVSEPAESVRPYVKTRLLRRDEPLYGDEEAEEWDSDETPSGPRVRAAVEPEEAEDEEEEDEDAIDEPDLELPDEDE